MLVIIFSYFVVKTDPLLCGQCVSAITLCQEIIFLKSLLKTNCNVIGHGSLRCWNCQSVIGIRKIVDKKTVI